MEDHEPGRANGMTDLEQDFSVEFKRNLAATSDPSQLLLIRVLVVYRLAARSARLGSRLGCLAIDPSFLLSAML